MKQRHLWLLALLSILTLMTTTSLTIAAEGKTSGHVEIGIAGMDTDDSPARVNEYVNTRAEKGLSFAPKLSLVTSKEGYIFGLDADIVGPRDQKVNLEFDAKRIFRFDLNYRALEHWKDHETLDQMGATARDDVDRSQPNVTTDKIMADLQDAGLNINTFAPANDPDGGVGGGTLNYDPRAAYEQELANNYIVTRRELESNVDLAFPELPNIVFHAGMRIETRKGLEQAIGVTKCDSCHVSATGKTIDERTEDFRLGATGKFGLFTVDYEYMNRTFSEDGAAPVRYYEDATNPNSYQLLHDNGDVPFARTPDSEKDSHSLRARVDLPQNTTITASYVKSDIESAKSATQDEYQLLQGDTLKTKYESFGGKLATKLGDFRLSLRGNTYTIDADGNRIYFDARTGAAAAASLIGSSTPTSTDTYHTAAEREVNELGFDVIYRLARGTTLRFGYDYEDVKREEEELGETETNTFTLALKSRINKQLSGNISYQYQDINQPFAGAHVGIAQGAATAIQDLAGDPDLWYFNTADFTPSAAVPTWYWSSVYPNRTLESSNQPESVHEAKFSTTWAPAANLAATVSARVRLEENDRVDYEQQTFVPGANVWYAPNSKMNLTMAYTFSKQDTENKMCVGWYHG